MAVISQIKATSDNVDYNIRDDYSIWGGRNLLLGTKTMTSVTTGDNTCVWNAAGGIVNGEGKIAATTGWTNIGYGGQLKLADMQDKTYVFSADVKAGTSGATYVPLFEIKNAVINSSARKNKYRTFSMLLESTNLAQAPTTEYQRYYFVFTLTSDVFTTQNGGNTDPVDWANDYLGLNIHNHNNYDYYTRNWKLELGNKPTDWSPAPEDIARFIGNETIELYSE